MPSRSPDPRPVFLRWTDYLTGRSCTLRIADADAGASLDALVAKYLAVERPRALVDAGLALPESVSDLQEIQDLAFALSDGGALLGVLPGAVYRSGVRELRADEAPPKTAAALNGGEVALVDASIDRSEVEPPRSRTGFARRRWDRNRAAFQDFVEETVAVPRADSRATPSLDSASGRVEFLRRLALAIWESPFENYSRFIGRKIPYKTGDETVMNIIAGRGGICSEKVQALKFLTDEYGFESRYVFAGPDAAGAMPSDRLRDILERLDFAGARADMRYWQHTALEYDMDGRRVLVDATNGNIPFIFAEGRERDRLLDERDPAPLRVRMGTYAEDFYYHRAPDDLAASLFYAMENYVPEIDLVQVFDNELGLVITEDFLIAPVAYRAEEEYEDLARLYADLTAPPGLDCDVSPQWSLAGAVGEAFQASEPDAARAVLDSLEHLRARCELFDGAGCGMGLAAVRLR